MKWVEVLSTSITAIGYDEGRRELGIEFRADADVYFYFDVPPEEYEAFLAAESKGRYLNLVVKPKDYRHIGPQRGRRRAA